MRSRERDAAIRDARITAEWLHTRFEGLSYEGFMSDEVLQAALERKLEIIGEALIRALRADESLVGMVPDLHRIIGLRNVLAHGYDVIDLYELHLIATTELSGLIMTLANILNGD